MSSEFLRAPPSAVGGSEYATVWDLGPIHVFIETMGIFNLSILPRKDPSNEAWHFKLMNCSALADRLQPKVLFHTKKNTNTGRKASVSPCVVTGAFLKILWKNKLNDDCLASISMQLFVSRSEFLLHHRERGRGPIHSIFLFHSRKALLSPFFLLRFEDYQSTEWFALGNVIFFQCGCKRTKTRLPSFEQMRGNCSWIFTKWIQATVFTLYCFILYTIFIVYTQIREFSINAWVSPVKWSVDLDAMDGIMNH